MKKLYRCDFEEDMCGFRSVQEPETKRLWERIRSDSEVSQQFDKPVFDHSKQTASVLLFF